MCYYTAMSEKIYYVYVYLREDDTPYYVGKGKGNRIHDKRHNVTVPKDENRRKILCENLTEKEALSLETSLISQYGRKDLGTGILRNMTNGGEGISGWVMPQECKDNLREQRLGKSYDERYGKEKAKRIKRKISEKSSGEKNGFYGKTHTESVKQNARVLREGKTYEEIMGPELAKKSKSQKSIFMTGREPGNKGKTLEEIHGEEKAAKLREQFKERFTGEKNPMFGVTPSKEQIERKRQEKLNAEKIQCDHCDKLVDPMNYGRWHGDKCKMKVEK